MEEQEKYNVKKEYTEDLPVTKWKKENQTGYEQRPLDEKTIKELGYTKHRVLEHHENLEDDIKETLETYIMEGGTFVISRTTMMDGKYYEPLSYEVFLDKETAAQIAIELIEFVQDK